jgi:hypothetical protein
MYTFCGQLAYLLPFGIFCGHLVNFMVIWYVFPRFGMLYNEKSGKPASNALIMFHLNVIHGIRYKKTPQLINYVHMQMKWLKKSYPSPQTHQQRPCQVEKSTINDIFLFKPTYCN